MWVGERRVCPTSELGQSSVGGGSGVSQRGWALCKENLSCAQGCKEHFKGEVPFLECEFLPRFLREPRLTIGYCNIKGKQQH